MSKKFILEVEFAKCASYRVWSLAAPLHDDFDFPI